MKKAWLLFVELELILYISFLWLDTKEGYVTLSSNLKYAGILLCLCWEFYVLKRQKNRNRAEYYKLLGMCFTAIADVFLLLLDQDYTVGVTAFCIVQMCYLCCMITDSRRRFKQIAVRLAVIAILYYFIFLLKLDVNVLMLLCVFYFINLLFNISYSIRERTHPFFTAGLVLLALCDIHVGIANSGFSLLYHIPIAMFVRYVIWLYYLPSQVLIALSINKNSREKNRT